MRFPASEGKRDAGVEPVQRRLRLCVRSPENRGNKGPFCGHSIRFLENIGTKMEDRGSNEVEQRIEDEEKRISQGGHNKEGTGRRGGPKTTKDD